MGEITTSAKKDYNDLKCIFRLEGGEYGLNNSLLIFGLFVDKSQFFFIISMFLKFICLSQMFITTHDEKF